MGRMDAAASAYRKALDVDPLHGRARQELVAVLLAGRRIAEASEVYRAAIAAAPDNAGLLIEAGEFFVRSGQAAKGVELLRRALVIEPERTAARYSLAVALLGMAGTDNPTALSEAIEHLQRVIRERPAFAEAHYNLGVAVFMSGRPVDAVAHIQESIRLDPADTQAPAFLEVVRREIEKAP
jgi:tetratricopeptide (TPR) repeat protein